MALARVASSLDFLSCCGVGLFVCVCGFCCGFSCLSGGFFVCAGFGFFFLLSFYESRLMGCTFTPSFLLLPPPPGLDGQWAAFHLVPTLTFSG